MVKQESYDSRSGPVRMFTRSRDLQPRRLGDLVTTVQATDVRHSTCA